MVIPDEVYDIGILNRKYHARLLQGIEHWAGIAGVPPHFIWSKLSQYCTDEDVAWVKNLKKGYDHGLVYTGKYTMPIEDKMAAIVGACLRNYVDARFMTVQQVLSRLKSDTMPSPTVVLVPNFCLAKEDTNNVAPWEAASILGWLYSRLAKNLKTVLYASDMKTVTEVYGSSMTKHLSAHYKII